MLAAARLACRSICAMCVSFPWLKMCGLVLQAAKRLFNFALYVYVLGLGRVGVGRPPLPPS